MHTYTLNIFIYLIARLVQSVRVIEHLIALGGAGLSDAWTTTKASAPCVEARQVGYIKGIYSLGS